MRGKLNICNHDQQLCISRIPIFSTLNNEELNLVISLVQCQFYSKNEFIYEEGSKNENLIIIQKGKLKAFSRRVDGREQIFYLLTDGDFMGVRNLISDNKASFSVSTMEDSHICKIDKCDFQKLFMKYPSIGWKAMEVLCKRLEKMEFMVKKNTNREADARVNMVLLEFAQKYGSFEKQGIVLELPLNREEMANYIGVSRETLSRKLATLKDEGVIQLISNKKILILDESALSIYDPFF